ncbi:hypothetical protein ACIBEK_34485 [Nocardia fusca]|uniref:hypothetical protein n=1 Tax=Nocardia fusca TaxID=941183 RepID=UPI00379F7F3C
MFRLLGAVNDARPSMPKTVAEAATLEALRRGQQLQGFNNFNYALPELGLFARMRKPSQGVDPRVLREYDTLRLLAKHEVKNVPLPYARLTDLCLEDRWVATESTPIVLTNMLPGRQATASDFYDNRDEILAGFRA